MRRNYLWSKKLVPVNYLVNYLTFPDRVRERGGFVQTQLVPYVPTPVMLYFIHLVI